MPKRTRKPKQIIIQHGDEAALAKWLDGDLNPRKQAIDRLIARAEEKAAPGDRSNG